MSTRTSLVVWWLRLCLPMQKVRVQSLVGDQRSHVPVTKKPKQRNRSNIVTSSIKTLKMVYIKKKAFKKTNAQEVKGREA